jgi:hypothetical protein
MPQFHKAVLSRITRDGVGYLVDQGSHKVFTFTFDKIPNYRGQSAAELGIAAGSPVTYDLDNSGYVSKVQLTQPAKKRWTLAW